MSREQERCLNCLFLLGSEKQTPLHVACSIGDLASIQLLLWVSWVDLNFTVFKDWMTLRWLLCLERLEFKKTNNTNTDISLLFRKICILRNIGVQVTCYPEIKENFQRKINTLKRRHLNFVSLSLLVFLEIILFRFQMKANPCLVDSLGQTPGVLAEQSGHLTCSKLLDAANRSKTDDETAMSQRCGSDVTSNGVNGRTHVNYIYTSAIWR